MRVEQQGGRGVRQHLAARIFRDASAKDQDEAGFGVRVPGGPHVWPVDDLGERETAHAPGAHQLAVRESPRQLKHVQDRLLPVDGIPARAPGGGASEGLAA